MEPSWPKTILITGAAQRIGRELALFCARRGSDIVIHHHHSTAAAQNLAREIMATGNKVAMVKGDLTSDGIAAAVMAEASNALGPIECLINNAAIFERDTIETCSQESFDRHVAVNLRAPLLLSQAFAKQLGNSAGNIINLTDGAVGWSISPNFLSYALSKKSLEHLTELLAAALAPRIRVNAIALGPTLPGAMDDAHTFEKLKQITPLQRVSSTEEVCRALEFLLSSPSVTGQIVMLNSGLHLPEKTKL